MQYHQENLKAPLMDRSQDKYLKSSYENVKSGSSTKVKEIGRPVMIQGFKNCTLEKQRPYMYGSRVVSTNRYT